MTQEMNMEMLEEIVQPKLHEVYTGTVMKVEKEQAFIHIGGKGEVILPKDEVTAFPLEDLNDVLKVNDKFEVIVISTNEGVKVSKNQLEQQRKWAEVKKKHEEGTLVQALVREVVKGGLVADIGLRAFIPGSMISNHYVKDLNEFIGQELEFQIIELDEKKNKIVLSRRELLEAEEQRKKNLRFSEIHVGDVLEGTVSRLANFGAFVDLGGLDGLLHVSQLSHERNSSPEGIVAVGQKVKVKVMEANAETGKIGLSMKALQEHPWVENAKAIQAGQILEGKVVKLLDFGAFIELAPHVEGLLHVSQISEKPVKKPADALQIGQMVKVKVQSVERKTRKISLSMKEVQADLEKQEVKKYQEQLKEENSSVSLGDLFGDALKKFQ